MATSRRFMFAGVVIVFGAGFLMGSAMKGIPDAQARSASLVYELRTYTTPEGKLPNLQARFRDHSMRIFENHDIINIGYWTPQDEPNASNTLVYIIAHESRETAAANWSAFLSDPEWRTVSRESQVDGRIVSNVEAIFLDPTDFSPIQ